MKLYVLTHISIHSVVSEVKHVTTFTPSKELPNSPSEALLLWINKISKCSAHKMKGKDTAVQKSPHFTSSDVMEVVKDGQSLAHLLYFYLPNSVKCSGKYKNFYKHK